MTNRLELRDGTVVARFNSFLVDTGDGVVAVTATPASSDRNQTDSPSLPGITVYPRPIAIADLRVEMKKWDMTVPPESKQKLTVSSIENMPARESRSLVLAVSSPGKDLPVRVLRPATKGGDPSGRVYIVACASSGSRCDQTVFTGQIRGRSVGTGRKFGYPQIILENEVPPENLTGSPVLNEDGLVVAVMLGESRGGMMVGSAQVATHAAEEIGLILENAGIWKP